MAKTAIELVEARLDMSDPQACWLWPGASVNGYGVVYPYDSRARKYTGVVAHRVIYEARVGPIPPRLDLDHLCHNPKVCPGGPACPHRACCNWRHLAIATRAQNMARSSIHWTNRSACLHDHPWPEQLMFYKSGKKAGYAYCGECSRISCRARARRRRDLHSVS